VLKVQAVPSVNDAQNAVEITNMIGGNIKASCLNPSRCLCRPRPFAVTLEQPECDVNS